MLLQRLATINEAADRLWYDVCLSVIPSRQTVLKSNERAVMNISGHNSHHVNHVTAIQHARRQMINIHVMGHATTRIVHRVKADGEVHSVAVAGPRTTHTINVLA